MLGIWVFSKNVNVVFIEKSEFFSKKPPFVTKTFSFQENLHFDKLKRVFPAFCTIFGINRDPCLSANVIDSIYWLCDKFELDELIQCVTAIPLDKC